MTPCSTNRSLTSRRCQALAALLLCLGCTPSAPTPAPADKTPQTSGTQKGKRNDFDIEAVRPQVEAFCGGCHAVPKPTSFPRKSWPREVNLGFEIFLGSGRNDLQMPAVGDVVAYFQSQAPEQLVFPKHEPAPGKSPFAFRAEPIVNQGQATAPLTASLAYRRLYDSLAPQLFTCDMASGLIEARPFAGNPGTALVLAQASQPCHLEQVDFDGDGVFEFVGAVLGSYQPGDHDRGQVLLLRPNFDGGPQPQAVVLLEKVGRVADVQPADFDGDGDIDLVVAEFGFIKTGGILLLRNQGGDQKAPTFTSEILDQRHGTIHVPVCDLNSDGRPDFIACISQDHETVVAFLNRGDDGFDKQILFAANDPAYGSNGIELVDLDRDGDLDVLYTNGDTLDSNFLKPYHGVRWLENRGEFPFIHHQIDIMPGASRALAGDFDGDGDLDVFATAYFPMSLRNLKDAPELDSAVIYENTGGEQFVRRRLETGNQQHMCLEVADVDADGDLDALIGHHASNLHEKPGDKPQVTLWRNLRIESP